MLLVVIVLLVAGTIVTCSGMWLAAKIVKMEHEARLPDYETVARKLEKKANEILDQTSLTNRERGLVQDLRQRADETRARGKMLEQQEREEECDSTYSW